MSETDKNLGVVFDSDKQINAVVRSRASFQIMPSFPVIQISVNPYMLTERLSDIAKKYVDILRSYGDI